MYDDEKFKQVPADFPRPLHLGSVSGAQDKLLLIEFDGQYYSLGCTPPEIYESWDNCEFIAVQLAQKAVQSKVGKRSHMDEIGILAQYLPRLIRTGWTSEDEARWVMRRVAAILGWSVPESCNG